MITVLTGNFGSGKTEIAVNLALRNKGTLIDLDLVNPYFRSRKAQEIVESKGVKIIVPPPYLANTDLPVVVPEVLGELHRSGSNVVIDVGGDNIGAIVLGRYRNILKDKSADILLVLNPYRPFTQDLIGVERMLQDIEFAAKTNIAGIISNPNLSRATNLQNVLEGHKKVEVISRKLNKPIRFLCCRQDLLAEVKALVTLPVMGLEIFMLAPWEM